MKHYGDITKSNGTELPPVDVITGGSPCQDLSIAGKRKGLAGKRSGLFMEQIRIIKEMREHDRASGRADEHIRPRFMVWENVPGAFSSNKGEDFRTVLEETAKIADENAVIPRPPKGKWTSSGCIMGNGWAIAWRVHDAQFWGVPQRRKRIALVADFGGESAPEILFERKGLSGDFEPCGTEREETAGAVGDGIEKTSTSAGFKGRQGSKARSIGYKEETSPTLSAENETHVCVYCLQGNGIDRADTAGCNGKGWRENESYTLNTIDRHAIFVPDIARPIKAKANCDFREDSETYCVTAVDCRNGTENHNTNGTLQAKSNGGMSVNLQNVCRQGTVVRRLTPLECTRLQGYPDGWVDIGEWTDSKGKVHKDADSPKYKALGNSIALPFWQWMSDKIVKRLKNSGVENPAMGSLFDGISGFPLVFARCGARTLWTSEIEEFPIAVCKRHFGNEDDGLEGNIEKYL